MKKSIMNCKATSVFTYIIIMHDKLSVICQKAKNSILHVLPYAPVPYQVHGLTS